MHGLSQVSHDLFDKNLHIVVCVKPSLAFRALTLFAKQAFMGGKNKEQNFTFELGSFAL